MCLLIYIIQYIIWSSVEASSSQLKSGTVLNDVARVIARLLMLLFNLLLLIYVNVIII